MLVEMLPRSAECLNLQWRRPEPPRALVDSAKRLYSPSHRATATIIIMMAPPTGEAGAMVIIAMVVKKCMPVWERLKRPSGS